MGSESKDLLDVRSSFPHTWKRGNLVRCSLGRGGDASCRRSRRLKASVVLSGGVRAMILMLMVIQVDVDEEEKQSALLEELPVDSVNFR